MSYKNLVGIACANKAEVFKRFRDFICKRNGSYDYSVDGVGWTLVDSSYAVDQHTPSTNDWFVIYSAGESGDDDLYFKCTYVSDYIKIDGYLYWNSTTHAGVTVYGNVNNWNIPNAAVPILWIYADLDSVFAISRTTDVSADYMCVMFGKTTNTLYSQDVVVSANPLTSGADRVIDVGTVPADWWVGQRVYIRDTVNIALITITAKTATTITATLATNYLAGAKLSADLGYFCSKSNAPFGSNVIAMLANHSGTLNDNISAVIPTIVTVLGNPDPLNSEHIVVPYILGAASPDGYLGEIRNIYSRNSAGMTAGNVYTYRTDGSTYRAFSIYSGVTLVVREV